MSESYFVHPKEHIQSRPDKAFKHTFFMSQRLLAGLNCLLPGQAQHLHDHPDQDKFYYVLSGEGSFTVGETERTCTEGALILAPAGIPHGVENRGMELLSFITVIAPFPAAN